jgi:SAM-dependent methyltransferase
LLPDPAAAIREWLRVLRPDGRLAIIEGTFLTDEQKPQPSSARKTLAAMVRTAGRAVSYCAKPAQWGTVPQRLRARCNGLLERRRTRHDQEAKYQEAHVWLPFYGGPSAAQLVSLLEGQGLRDVVVEPLMDDALWGKVPPFPRYLVVGRR